MHNAYGVYVCIYSNHKEILSKVLSFSLWIVQKWKWKKIVYINLHINNGTSCLSVVRFMSSIKPNIYHRHRSDVLTESRHSSGKLVAQFNLNVGRGCYFRCIWIRTVLGRFNDDFRP